MKLFFDFLRLHRMNWNESFQYSLASTNFCSVNVAKQSRQFLYARYSRVKWERLLSQVETWKLTNRTWNENKLSTRVFHFELLWHIFKTIKETEKQLRRRYLCFSKVSAFEMKALKILLFFMTASSGFTEHGSPTLIPWSFPSEIY